MWSNWLVFCDCGFQSVCPLMEKDKRLMEASWWKRLTEGKLSLVLMGRTMLSKSLIQFSVGGGGYVLSLLFDLRPNYVEVMKIMGPPLKGPRHTLLHSVPPNLQQATADPPIVSRLLDIMLSDMLLEISGEITPERMKRWNQSESNTYCGCDWWWK